MQVSVRSNLEGCAGQDGELDRALEMRLGASLVAWLAVWQFHHLPPQHSACTACSQCYILGQPSACIVFIPDSRSILSEASQVQDRRSA